MDASGAFDIIVFFAFSEPAFKFLGVAMASPDVLWVSEGLRGLAVWDRVDGRLGFGAGACALSASVAASAAARSAARAAFCGVEAEGEVLAASEASVEGVVLEVRVEGSS